MVRASQRAVTTWTRIGFVALCGVLGVGCLSETRYVCPPGSDVTASQRCGAACASGELSAEECVLVEAACADGRLSAVDCEGLGGDMGVRDMGDEDAGDNGPDGDVVTEVGVDAGPCGMDCVGPEPHCNMTTGECVECLDASDCAGQQCSPEGVCVDCLDASHCDEPTPVCVAGDCVGCGDNTDCGPTNPVCESATQSCGDCEVRLDCTEHDDATPACNPTTGQCVACDVMNESADCLTPNLTRCNGATGQCVQCTAASAIEVCTTAGASRCNGPTNTCAPCTADAHCSHIAGRLRCFNNTLCVQCLPSSEATDCGANSCNPLTRMCSGTVRGSRMVCQSCVSDSDCSQAGGTARCIELDYQGASKGGYCLRQGPAGCQRPFLTPIVAGSLSGAADATYCGIDQTVVSCEAVNALRGAEACPSGDDSECMADGAICSNVGLSLNQCTYLCGNANQCPVGISCNGSHCGS